MSQRTSRDGTDEALRKLTLEELRALKSEIEDAIRAGIRAQRLAKTPAARPAQAEDAPAPITQTDLERERDAWLSSRR